MGFDNFQDLNNFESDPEEFARTFCRDLAIDDPEVGVSTKKNRKNFMPHNEAAFSFLYHLPVSPLIFLWIFFVSSET